MKPHHQKAFTIIELLVGMLLSSLVLTFAWQSYTIGYKQFYKQRDTNSAIHEKFVLEKRLKNLISKATPLECKFGKLYHAGAAFSGQPPVSDSLYQGLEYIRKVPFNCECWDNDTQSWNRSDILLENCLVWRE
jgi:prepilin-type N-terminal cleavage/methylation domain-containing protein